MGTILLVPGRVAVLGKVDDIPYERRLTWNEQNSAERDNITPKEHR